MKMKPSNSIFTDSQWEAIVHDNENIIVSAGAGSGKTAVLTERVIEKIKSGIHINKLIIITFTKAAAFEMKTRIKNKLIELVEKDSSYKEEIDLLEEAMITTYDSLALYIVKKYHYLLGIDRNISVVDKLDLNIKAKEIISDIFEEYYLSNNAFKEMIDTYTVKDDNKIIEYVMNFYNKVDIMGNPIGYLDNYFNNYYSEEYFKNIEKDYLNILSNLKEAIFNTVDALHLTELDSSIIDSYLEKLDVLNYAKTYNDYKNAFDNYKAPTVKKDDYSEEELALIDKYRKKITELIKEIKDATIYSDINEALDEIRGTKKYALVFRDILKELFIRLDKYKRSINAYTFTDITRLAIQILEEEEPKKEFALINEIMIDEFQDTNDIGEYFVSKMSHNNVYTVGDVKQSIYRFRNANPNIFMEKYDKYKKNNGGYAIDLIKNFRSRSEVLDDINMIFSPIFDNEIGGADYTNGHAMEFGNSIYNELREDKDYHLEIFDYEKKPNINNVEVEATLIAKDIREKIDNKIKVVKDKNLEDITYQDIAVIVATKANFDIYKKVFEEYGIPSLLYSATSFASSNEIYVIKNILALINKKRLNNPDIRYNFISITRSYLFDYQDKDIFKAVTDNNMEDNPIFKELFIKINNLVTLSNTESLSNLLLSIYQEFDMYSKSIRLGNIDLINKKLDYLVDVFKSLEELDYDFEEVLAYLDNIYNGKEDIDFSEKPDSSMNAVRIMSIHASKGLEFSYCYFPELTKKFNIQDIKGSFLYDDNYGFILPIFKEGKKDTILKKLAVNKYLYEQVSERIRTLYVALTRAKEKIILLAPFSSSSYLPVPIDTKVNTLVRVKYSSFMNIFESIKTILDKYIVLKDVEVKKLSTKQVDMSSIPKKEYTFTEKYLDIHSKKKETKSYSHTRSEIKKIDASEGLNLHEVLEYLDFNNPKVDIDKYNLSDYLKDKILKLFDMPFMEDIKNKRVFKEFEFYSDEIGIIDLLIEDEDKYIVVDYKLKDIDHDYYDLQVSKYMEYIRSITNKKVEGYLYSIIDSKYRKIDK